VLKDSRNNSTVRPSFSPSLASSSLTLCLDNILGYCLLRTTDQIDESITTKFVFINWLGENAPRMQKSRISIHIGPVKQFFGVCEDSTPSFVALLNPHYFSNLTPTWWPAILMNCRTKSSCKR